MYGKRRADLIIDARDSAADEYQSAGPSDEQSKGDAAASSKSKSKRGRSLRRNVAKSDPPSKLAESHDGAQDSDVTAVSSGEGQPLLQSSTTVSHP